MEKDPKIGQMLLIESQICLMLPYILTQDMSLAIGFRVFFFALSKIHR